MVRWMISDPAHYRIEFPFDVRLFAAFCMTSRLSLNYPSNSARHIVTRTKRHSDGHSSIALPNVSRVKSDDSRNIRRS
jgi:hypothetical protein